MGTSILCDGCGIDVASLDRISLNFGTMETGSVQADLCMDCSAEIWETKIWKKLIADATAAVAAENARRQKVLEDQRVEFERRAEVALQQEKKANAALRAAGKG